MSSCRKSLALSVAILTVVSLLAGCGGNDRGPSFSVVADLTKLDPGLQTSISLTSYARGYAWFEDETGGYLCVSYGNDSQTAPEITSVTVDKRTLKATVADVPVASGAASSAAKLTVVRVDGATGVTASVTDAKGNAMVLLNPSSGIYAGQIDGHSIEITTQGGAIAFQLADSVLPFFTFESPLFRNFESGDRVQFCYYRNANDQLVITYIGSVK